MYINFTNGDLGSSAVAAGLTVHFTPPSSGLVRQEGSSIDGLSQIESNGPAELILNGSALSYMKELMVCGVLNCDPKLSCSYTVITMIIDRCCRQLSPCSIQECVLYTAIVYYIYVYHVHI